MSSLAPRSGPAEAVGTRYVFDAENPAHLSRAALDLRLGLIRWRLGTSLAWLDIRNRYRGSVLGPLWVTLSTAVMLAGLGLLYAALFELRLAEYLPHLAISLIVWNMIAQIVNEATTSLISSESIIRQLPLPYTTHALRCVLRNVFVAAHNLPLVLIVFLICGWQPGPIAVLSLVGFAILFLNAFAAALLLGMLCARFRDIGPIAASVMQLAFFMTPVLWKPELLGAGAVFLPLNPFYAIMETVRGPLVEAGAPLAAWLAALLYTGVHLTVATAFFVRFRGRIAYWV